MTGVDCYSNDRCRRDEPEPIHRFIVFDIPRLAIVLTLVVASLLIACLSCCHYCVFNVKGAYDDLATISMAASRPPSVIGGTFAGAPSEGFYTTLETYPEEAGEGEADIQATEEASPSDEESPAAANGNTAVTATESEPLSSIAEGVDSSTVQVPERQELESNPDDLLNMAGHSHLTTPLLPASARSFNGIQGMEEPPHMKALYRVCSCLYYLSILLIISLVAGLFTFFPKPPVYNVCNDALAWKRIMESIVALKLDASFEILVSVSNPNHVTVILEKATGSFSFDGEPIGIYEIPPETIDGMAITDVMLIAHVQPDRYQALRLAEAYFRGNLLLNADFNAKLRAPAMFDITYDVHMKDIDVYVNELGPRDLCHCPSWDDAKNHTDTSLAFFN